MASYPRLTHHPSTSPVFHPRSWFCSGLSRKECQFPSLVASFFLSCSHLPVMLPTSPGLSLVDTPHSGIYRCSSLSLAGCYGLNVYVAPKFICWSPKPQGDGIWKWSLWEVIRCRWGHGGGPHDGISAFIRRWRDQSSLFLPSVYQEENGYQELDHAAILISHFQPPEPWEINVCCLNHPVCGNLL